MSLCTVHLICPQHVDTCPHTNEHNTHFLEYVFPIPHLQNLKIFIGTVAASRFTENLRPSQADSVILSRVRSASRSTSISVLDRLLFHAKRNGLYSLALIHRLFKRSDSNDGRKRIMWSPYGSSTSYHSVEKRVAMICGKSILPAGRITKKRSELRSILSRPPAVC